jgi:hypothetical protein
MFALSKVDLRTTIYQFDGCDGSVFVEIVSCVVELIDGRWTISFLKNKIQLLRKWAEAPGKLFQ